MFLNILTISGSNVHKMFLNIIVSVGSVSVQLLLSCPTNQPEAQFVELATNLAGKKEI